MKPHQELASLGSSRSFNNFNYKSAGKNITPSNFTTCLSIPAENPEISDKLLRSISSSSSPRSAFQSFHSVRSRFSSLLRSFIKMMAFPNIVPTRLSLTHTIGRKVMGTLFGNRRGHFSFAVQDDPRSEPVLLLELAMSTSSLVKEMSSGLLRIALECKKVPSRTGKLLHEPVWTMYCNGRKNGYAVGRTCNESYWHVLSTMQSVSVGAGVIPAVEDAGKDGGGEGEVLYMRAKFERVVGNRDSEAFYMVNLDSNVGPELSIFLLRI
ncbi:Protein MIZU-KUSSEI 1 [Hibiscus syriacus]|uniref:Protein MIZU-KUSSEI 1 n=1 Tax=Hibiscus syriacus TaxID=106335 RepID=A0A6A3D570_HIBSY|nr:protein MIZU-KUSSEI 1-like [Hibiscus syriacus]KAE8734379.1 Protein MIZU-KUSSEI 1 [Hibiscus syriacus]